MKSRILPPLLFAFGLLFLTLGSPHGIVVLSAALLLMCLTCAPRQPALYAFPSNCEGRIINVSSSAGCTLTRADIRGFTPQDFEDQGFKEVGMDKVYASAREARVAGYRENSWMALLMSRITNIKGALSKSNISMSESVILPYISRRQKRNINRNYWSVTAGAANPQAGTGDTPASAWDLTITNNPSAMASTLQDLHNYFLPSSYLFVEYSDATTSVAYSNAYKVIRAATVGGVTKVTVEPNYSAAGWAALTAAQKLVYQIGGVGGGSAATGTIAFSGVNSVSDFESLGGQYPAENTNSLLHFWPQTSRIVHEYHDEYLRALNAALTSEYFKQFRQLPLAQQRVRQQALYDQDMLNSAFFGQRINENQTVEGYRNLPTVVDPANPNCVLEYKANALGFKTQLQDCGRFLDHQGNPLNLDSLLNAGFLVKRARQADGSVGMDEEPVIDAITDPSTAGQIRDIMITFYKAKYGAGVERFYNPNQTLSFEKQVMFKYTTYQIPDELGGYVLAVFSSEVLRDRLAAAGGANRQRYIFMLDWSDIELGVAGTNSAVRRTNEADALYRYVIKINIQHVTLNSMTWCPIIEDPNRHYGIQNFSNACPTLTVSGCTV
jgi:hypothetical protein